MTLSIVTACIGRLDINDLFLTQMHRMCGRPHELVMVSNGSTDEENEILASWLKAMQDEMGWTTKLLTHPHPLGTSAAFNRGVEAANGDVVACLQNDLLILQHRWDEEVEAYFKDVIPASGIGIVGFAGGKGIGSPALYQQPYELHQLARNNVYTSLEDWPVHGAHATAPVRVAVLDGIAMIFRKDQWERWGGYDERYFHHMYDIDLSVTAHYAGNRNYVVPILCKHLNGQSVSGAVYHEATKERGGDPGIHAESHRLFYEKWRGRLPLSVQ